MALIGRIFLAIVGAVLFVEAVYGFTLVKRLEATKREPITVGKELEELRKNPGPLTGIVDSVLKVDIDTPTPADRLPPILPPQPRLEVAGQAGAAGDAVTKKPEQAVTNATEKSVAIELPKNDMPALQPPMPQVSAVADGKPALETLPAEKSEPGREVAVNGQMAGKAATGMAIDGGKVQAGTDQPQPPALEPPKAAGTAPAPPAPRPEGAKEPEQVAVVMPKPNVPSPFAPRASEIAPAPVEVERVIVPFVRPPLGPVLTAPEQISRAAAKLVELGAKVDEALDGGGKALPGMYAVHIDPNPAGQGITRLNFQLQAALSQAIGGMGDSLYALTLRNVGVGNLNAVGRLGNLVKLDLTGSDFLNIQPLTNLQRLEELNVSGTHVDNMLLLGQIRNLRVVNLNGNRVLDITALGNLQGLEELSIADTMVQSLQVVARLPRLKLLDASGSKVVDISPLGQAYALERLGLARTQVADLRPLANCSKLSGVDLGGCPNVRDLSALGNLKRLQSLSLFMSPVVEIGPLGQSSSIQTLELSRTQVRNVEAVSAMKALKYLYLRGLAVESLEPLTRAVGLQLVDLTQTQTETVPDVNEVANALRNRGVDVKP